MKKLFIWALAGTMILAASCQREQQFTDSTGKDGVKEVTTQFVLNVAAAPSTKMTAGVVQQNQNFRGIEQGKLYAYKSGVTSGTPYVLDPNSTAEKEFDLGLFLSDGGLDNSGNNNQAGTNSPASKRILQLSIPVNVDAVTFYGKAIKATGVADADFGATEATLSGKPAETVFKATKILAPEEKVTEYDQTGALMITIINDILSTSVPAFTTPGTIGAIAYDELPAISWAQLGHQYEIDHYPGATRYANTTENVANGIILGRPVQDLEEVLGGCYYRFTYIRPSDNPYPEGSAEWVTYIQNESSIRPNGEYRAGSSAAVRSMIIDTYRVITAAAGSEPANVKEANAQRLAEAILERAKIYINDTNGHFYNVSTLKSKLINQHIVADEAAWNSKFGKVMDVDNYPYGRFGVPEGAAQLNFHPYGTARATDKGGGTYPKDEFDYYHPNKPLVNPTMTYFEPRKYIYPAELWYYVNSPIRTTSTDVTTDSFPDGVASWNTATEWTGWTYPGKVESSTRGVAVANSINYGVAMLKSTVVYKDGLTAIQDNRKAMTNGTEENNTILISTNPLQLRGILIGGVNPRMNWQFVRKYETTGDPEGIGDLSLFDGVIYDHSLSTTAIPNTASPNYTLVYDNYNSSGAGDSTTQNDVYIALEMVNSGSAFWGRDNLIPAGGVFYLVAKVPAPDASDITDLASKWPTDHQIPPVDANGVSRKVARVFIQDFVTNATFRINETSLQHAYYSTPDLRASQMSLGLSVDLQWISGLDYLLDL